MLSLSDEELHTIMLAAGPLAPEKRSVFLERVAAQLSRSARGRGFSDTDLDTAVQMALCGLAHEAA
jgi:hypothetical protein